MGFSKNYKFTLADAKKITKTGYLFLGIKESDFSGIHLLRRNRQ
jgi:hypothetical protein